MGPRMMGWIAGLLWMAMATGGCQKDQGDAIADPQGQPLEVWKEQWDNGRLKVEYQYYCDEKGAIVKHGYYREYSYFVNGLVTVEGNYYLGNPVGEWHYRCKSKPLPYIFENGDFEFGNFTGWKLEGARENSFELISDDRFKERGYFAKLTLYPGDIVRRGNRVELVRLDPSNYREERIYTWSFMLDENYQDEPYWQAFCQFHSQPDFSQGEDWDNYPFYKPPISILYFKGICTLKLIPPPDRVPMEIGRFKVEKGKWFEVYFQIKWSPDSDGYVEMYVDDRPVTPFNGVDHKFYSPNVNNEMGNYLKIGLYRDKRATAVNTVYVDRFNVSACE